MPIELSPHNRGRLCLDARVVRLALSFALAVAAVGCRELPSGDPDAAADSDGYPYPPPRSGVVPSIGGPSTLEIAAWNIENFPAEAGTPSYVADLITSLELDVIVCEEIASEDAWAELIARLREHDGVLSPHRYSATEYQKVGVIYRTSMVTPGALELLFPTDGYPFPRPPLSLPLAIDDGTHAPLAIEVIGVHLKAGVSAEDGERRRLAIDALDQHLRAQIDGGGEDEVVIAGDYNEVVTTAAGQTNLAALLTAPDRYTVRTQPNAAGGEISFVPSSRLIDHITTTAGLAAETAGAQVVIPRLQVSYPGYVNGVSDHLPVVLVVPLQPR